MLDRSKCKKMFVKNKGHCSWHERIVIEQHKDGSCFAVAEYHEESFNQGGEFGIDYWKYSEEIPEKKMRWMTHEEIFAMIQKELKEGVLVLFKSQIGTITMNWHSSNNPEMHPYSLDLGKTWHKLEVEE